MDRDDHEREVTQLRRRLAALTEEARKNDEAWRRAQAREMELLEADTLDALLERLTTGLRASYRLDAATLVIADPDHEIRRLLAPQGGPSAGRRRRCSSIPCTASRRRSPRGAGRGSASSIAPTTRCCSRRPTRSRAWRLLPLTRQERLIGCLNFGSRERERFLSVLGTDFLHHLAVIAAFSLESAVEPRAARPQRLHGRADGVAQPALSAVALAGGARALPPRADAADVSHDRRRPLQIGQRSLRALGRRRGAAAARALHQRRGSRQRRVRSLWRRGVRRAVAGHRASRRGSCWQSVSAPPSRPSRSSCRPGRGCRSRSRSASRSTAPTLDERDLKVVGERLLGPRRRRAVRGQGRWAQRRGAGRRIAN